MVRPLAWLIRVVLVVAVAAGAIALSLWLTPMQQVTTAGQTIRVGVAAPSWSLSGPGEVDLFGQRIPTVIDFTGPVRPRLELTHITLGEQLAQFAASGPAAAGQAVEHALVHGWTRFFIWQLVVAGIAAVVLFGAFAGWLRRGWRRTIGLIVVGVVVTGALDAGAVMITAYSVPSKLAQVGSLQDLVGGVPLPALPETPAAPHTPISRVVVVGDSTAAGLGLRALPHPSADDKACGRSRDAFALDLAAANDWQVTNLACSGATVAAGLLGPQTAGGVTLPPQLGAAAVTHADLVIVSIGANDVNWSTILGICAVTTDCANAAEQAFLQQQLAVFSTDFLQLLTELQQLPNHPAVLINQYYDPFPGDAHCLASHGMTSAKHHALRSDLAALNTVLTEGAKAAGFTTADPDFTGHGLCSPQPYIQGLADKAPFHPTAPGQLAIALADERALHTPPDR